MNFSLNNFDNIDSSIFYSDIADKMKIREILSKNGNIENYEIEIVSYSKEKNWTLMSANIIDYNGDDCLLMSINDISERKRIESEIIKAKITAEEALKIKSQFLSVMSHEIRTPLNAVIGITELLLDGNPRSDQIENIKSLHYSSNNLLSIVNEVLDFSKIEEQKLQLEKNPFDLFELMSNIKSSFDSLALKKGLNFNLIFDKEISKPILGDTFRLTQVFNNLISNALKFTLKGEVAIKVKLFQIHDNSVKFLFSIQGTGIGIKQDKLNYIFESFTQASSETTRAFGGTGLGLTITKKIIELMGGQIKVESVLNQGSNFSFDLEFELYNDEIISTELLRNEVKSEGIKILVAEDNDVNVLIISQFLNKWGIEFDIAINGLEAVDMVSKFDYDMVLMDMQMPELDGIDASIQIRKMGGKYLDLNILILSAASESEIKQQLKIARINDYISKPFVSNLLHEKILYYSKKNN